MSAAKKEGEKLPFLIICPKTFFAAMKFNDAIKLMEENRRVYDSLAEDFSRTRSAIWEEFKSLKDYFQDGEKVLDLGCGNGRFFELFQDEAEKKVQYFGVDNSPKLLEMAKQRHPQAQFILTDGLNLPFAENFFDKILCIAVLHHLPGDELRRQFLRQAYRVLRPGGLLILTAWYLWPNLRIWRHTKLFLKYTFLKLVGRSKLDWGDTYEPWGKKGQRYFHNISPRELKGTLDDVGFKIESISLLIRKSGEKSLVVIAKK